MNLLPLVPGPVECNDIIERVTFMTTKYAYSPELNRAYRSRGCVRNGLEQTLRARGREHSCVT